MDRIILRAWRDCPGNPIALFVDKPGRGTTNQVTSYQRLGQRLGQHGPANLGIVRETVPVAAESPEGVRLLTELRGIGYNPRVLKRVPANRKRY